MKKIIDGFRYDTEKAGFIGRYNSGHPSNDFQWWTAALYCTKVAKRFFLAGEGGPMTQFSRRSGDGIGYGEKIIPMSAEEALAWAEQYLDPDEFEKYFQDQIQDA